MVFPVPGGNWMSDTGSESTPYTSWSDVLMALPSVGDWATFGRGAFGVWLPVRFVDAVIERIGGVSPEASLYGIGAPCERFVPGTKQRLSHLCGRIASDEDLCDLHLSIQRRHATPGGL